MEIKVGEYVRTKKGIAKIVEIFQYDDGNKDYYTDVCIDDEDNTMILHKHQIIKHSKNTIDLIEVGDYINGGKVHETGNAENGRKWVHTLNGNLYYEEDIKTILTHEQYEQNYYRLEE